MKTWKLIAGIISIVLFMVVTFQSCAAGFVNALENNGNTSGSVGFFVGLLMLAGGITSICARNKKNGGNVAIIILFGLAGIIGIAGHGNYSDLLVWSVWCLINSIVAIIDLVKIK